MLPAGCCCLCRSKAGHGAPAVGGSAGAVERRPQGPLGCLVVEAQLLAPGNVPLGDKLVHGRPVVIAAVAAAIVVVVVVLPVAAVVGCSSITCLSSWRHSRPDVGRGTAGVVEKARGQVHAHVVVPRRLDGVRVGLDGARVQRPSLQHYGSRRAVGRRKDAPAIRRAILADDNALGVPLVGIVNFVL